MLWYVVFSRPILTLGYTRMTKVLTFESIAF
jgi:hypothetical protein